LAKKAISAKECFIIMPISDPSGYESGHFRKVYEEIYKPACVQAGFDAVRADSIKDTNLIHLDIIGRLVTAPMAICDLSSHNPNVLFELGIRQAFNMPVVLVQEEKTSSIFDISPLRYIEYRKKFDYTETLEDQKRLYEALMETEKATSEGENVNSIVQLLNVRQAMLVNSDDASSVDAKLGYIMQEIDGINSYLRHNFSAKTSSQKPSNEEYLAILDSMDALTNMVKSGTPKFIVERNFNDIKSRISAIKDMRVSEMLLKESDRVRLEIDRFL
jgi:hypothetical protein